MKDYINATSSCGEEAEQEHWELWWCIVMTLHYFLLNPLTHVAALSPFKLMTNISNSLGLFKELKAQRMRAKLTYAIQQGSDSI